MHSISTIFSSSFFVCIFLSIGALLSVIYRKLTITGGITGFMVGLAVFIGVGYVGIAMLAAFFLLGSLSTRWQLNKKRQIGLADQQSITRTAGQVLANGGISGILGLIAWYQPVYVQLCCLMMAGSLASATADTLSSELGTIYGKRFYDIITFKKSEAGPDGVISLEGTLIGIGGAIIISLIYAIDFGFSDSLFVIICAGFTGNFVDSLLGATLERKQLTGNNLVNFLNTIVGAGMCWVLSCLIKR